MSTDRTSDPPKGTPEGSPPSENTPAPVVAEPSVFAVGHVLAGKYRIEGMLGRGGMGVVHAGRQLELDRPVAIKCLRRSPGQSERSAQRFAREARAIAKMRSEHVVRIFDVGVEGELPFIVMERLVGRDLGEELDQGPLSVENTAKYVLQACEAIAEAHSLGIVHRDLKPSNLFLAETLGELRTIKVLDFGVSKWLGPTPDFETPLSTSAHGFVGTPAYVSPEQLTRPDAVDERTDVWALGVVLYRCVSGRVPFDTESVPRLCAEILTANPRPFDPPSVVPEGFREIILRCLEKKPEARYRNILELARALAPFAPPAERRSLELIERLAQRPNPEVETKRASEPAVASTPPNQSTTAGYSQDARVAGAGAPARFDAQAFGRRALWALLGVLAIGGAVATTRARREPAPPAPSRVVEPDRSEPPSAAATAVPTPSPRSTTSAPPAISPESAPPPAASGVVLSRRDTTRRPLVGTRAPAASAPPAPSAAVPPATPPSASPPVIPSAAPTAGSSDDFDRHIYRR
jgi:serine/threonine-protein kinase